MSDDTPLPTVTVTDPTGVSYEMTPFPELGAFFAVDASGQGTPVLLTIPMDVEGQPASTEPGEVCAWRGTMGDEVEEQRQLDLVNARLGSRFTLDDFFGR